MRSESSQRSPISAMPEAVAKAEFEVSEFHLLLNIYQKQVATHGALVRDALQRPLSACKPAGSSAGLAAHEKSKAIENAHCAALTL